MCQPFVNSAEERTLSMNVALHDLSFSLQHEAQKIAVLYALFHQEIYTSSSHMGLKRQVAPFDALHHLTSNTWPGYAVQHGLQDNCLTSCPLFKPVLDNPL